VPARARARLQAAVDVLAAQGHLSGLRVRALDTALWPHGGIAALNWPQRLACVALPTDARLRQGHWPSRWRGWLDGGGLPLLFLGRDGPPAHHQALLPVSLGDDARARARIACLGLLASGGTAEWLHVSDLPRHRIDPGSRVPRRVLDQVLQAEYRARYLRLLALAQHSGLPGARCYVAQGAVATAIERHQRTLGHDLVVLGWGHRTAVGRCWRPPLAEGLLRRLDCDLLVLPTGGRP
jgi:nucleotide-binding universal stress UspA family protein